MDAQLDAGFESLVNSNPSRTSNWSMLSDVLSRSEGYTRREIRDELFTSSSLPLKTLTGFSSNAVPSSLLTQYLALPNAQCCLLETTPPLLSSAGS
jgi:hypothetical protein